MFVIAGLVLGLIFLFMGADINFALLPFIGGIVIQAIPRQYVIGAPAKRKRTSRAEAEKWLRESGHLGSTPEVIAAERETFNKNSREWAASLEGGSQAFYYDFDGCPRDVVTNEYL